MGPLRQTSDERDDRDHSYSDQNNLDWRQILFCGAELLANVKTRAGVRRRTRWESAAEVILRRAYLVFDSNRFPD